MIGDEGSGGSWEDEGSQVLISALEHYSYCPRQCALIHLEQTYDENEFTMRGRMAHEQVHQEGQECNGDIRIVRGMTLWSRKLGLLGKADVVEFREAGPYPVEYKVGRHRGAHAELQLCAQAMCLEEMLGVPVAIGAIYYRGARQRKQVKFVPNLRARVEEVVSEVRRMLASERLPEAHNDARCPHCSLRAACMPEITSDGSVLRGLQGVLFRPSAVAVSGVEEDG